MAKFTGYPIIGLVPLTVKFTNESSNGSQFKWKFGDSITSEGENPTHTYTSPGLYTVQLTVMNVTGCDTVVKTNYIKVISDINNKVSCNICC